MEKEIHYEIYWLRFISCLAVVGIHAISSALMLHSGDNLGITEYALYVIQMGLMFGTPAFIFISEFLLAKSYPNGLPKGFFKKRAKFLLIPYLIMAIMYGLVFAEEFTLSSVALQIAKNVFMGDFVAYFILVIFQFYILHFFLHGKLKQWNMKNVLGITLAINILYLGFFNFVPSPESPFLSYVWSRGHWLLIPAWLFYFSLGYYSGKHYTQLLRVLNKQKTLLLISPVFLLMIVVALRYLGFPDTTSSKRIDVIFYTTSIIFLIMYVSSKIKTIPSFVLFISRYSFSIYLLHKFVVDTSGRITDNIFIHTIVVFVLGVAFSVAVSFAVNKIPFGYFVVGKIGNTPQNLNKYALMKNRKQAM